MVQNKNKGGSDLDSDEAKTCGNRRNKDYSQEQNRNNTFQSDTPAGRRIFLQDGAPKIAKLPLKWLEYMVYGRYTYSYWMPLGLYML